jgi:hypothetical protein
MPFAIVIPSRRRPLPSSIHPFITHSHCSFPLQFQNPHKKEKRKTLTFGLRRILSPKTLTPKKSNKQARDVPVVQMEPRPTWAEAVSWFAAPAASLQLRRPPFTPNRFDNLLSSFAGCVYLRVSEFYISATKDKNSGKIFRVRDREWAQNQILGETQSEGERERERVGIRVFYSY